MQHHKPLLKLICAYEHPKKKI